MKIAGFTPLSLVDYPGQVCAVIFTQGCNLRCPFCHNSRLIPLAENQNSLISWETIRSRLVARNDLVSTVVVSGGEPTLQSGLIEMLRELRCLRFRIKLDTNGTGSEQLESILREGLVDYVALDVKAPFDERMHEASGRVNVTASMQKSLSILSQSSVSYEVRTTCHNGINADALRDIAHAIPADARWFIQKCNSHFQYQSVPRTSKWAQEQVRVLRSITHKVKLRGWNI